MQPRSLYEKLWRSRSVRRIDERHVLLYADLHVMNEYTSPQAFSGLEAAGRTVRRPAANLGIIDHVNSTGGAGPGNDAAATLLIKTFARNCAAHGITLFDLLDPRQGIEHIVVPEQGMALPGMTILCGDSHTTTYGAFGALGFGIGTSDVEHVLATQAVVYRPLRPMRVMISGTTGPGVTAKDLVMSVIARIGAAGANGHAVEFAGEAIAAQDMAGRMTICNMAVEAGARAAVIAPDDVTFAYLAGRPHAPAGAMWDRALREWAGLRSDPDAVFDREVLIDAADIAPLVTWGTSPDQVVPISARVPDPAVEQDPHRRRGGERALAYMGLSPGTPMEEIAIDRVFIGSCTNSRIEDLRAVAHVVAGRRVAPGVTALVVPGSWDVRRAAEAEGIATILTNAGFEWRTPGCSMCLAMNDDVAAPGERCASSTNRNFEGRQGRDARTHLMSPAMAAAAAVTGKLTDVRRLHREAR